jgi:hypothetical protein
MDIDTPAIYSFNCFGNVNIKLEIAHIANKVPGFAFSKYSSISFANSNILISEESYAYIVEQMRQNVKASND